VDRWLTKPIRPSLLFNSLHELFLPSDRGNGDFVDPSTVRIPRHAWRKDVRVLVVEDNLTNQILVKEQLGVLGYTVRIVDNASLALEILAQKEHDIVLMDCELPGLNGYEATAELRRREGNGKHIKVVALTADATENQRKRCLDAGMNDCLIKPVKLQMLAENLDTYSRIEGILAGNMLPAPSARGGEALDPAALAEIAQLSKATGRNVFRRLVTIFVSDLSRQVELIAAAVESSNMNQLVLVIHPLVSASAFVGAKQFSGICAKVEQHARDGIVDQANSFARELLKAAQALPAALFEAADDR
jgi:CheY-like chemotaxis protein